MTNYDDNMILDGSVIIESLGYKELAQNMTPAQCVMVVLADEDRYNTFQTHGFITKEMATNAIKLMMQDVIDSADDFKYRERFIGKDEIFGDDAVIYIGHDMVIFSIIRKALDGQYITTKYAHFSKAAVIQAHKDNMYRLYNSNSITKGND